MKMPIYINGFRKGDTIISTHGDTCVIVSDATNCEVYVTGYGDRRKYDNDKRNFIPPLHVSGLTGSLSIIDILYNVNLRNEFKDIKDIGICIDISKSNEVIINKGYNINVEGTFYWYSNKNDRDHDYSILKLLLSKRFNFID